MNHIDYSTSKFLFLDYNFCGPAETLPGYLQYIQPVWKTGYLQFIDTMQQRNYLALNRPAIQIIQFDVCRACLRSMRAVEVQLAALNPLWDKKGDDYYVALGITLA